MQGILDSSSELVCAARWSFVLDQIQSGWSSWQEPSSALATSSTAILRCRNVIRKGRAKLKKLLSDPFDGSIN